MTPTPTATRAVLSLALLGTIAAVIGFQWGPSHVFNPEWHPHARFHAAQLVGCVSALCGLGLWSLWRRTGPQTSTTWPLIAGLVCFWGAEFFALAIPGTSPSPDLEQLNTFDLLGWDVHGNLFLAAIMIIVSVAAGITSTIRTRPRGQDIDGGQRS